MPIVQVLLSDTFDEWRQKTNSMINTVNSLSAAGNILSIANPLVGQILVYNGTVFRNVPMSGDITLDANGGTTIVGGVTNAISKGRLLFIGAMRGLY